MLKSGVLLTQRLGYLSGLLSDDGLLGRVPHAFETELPTSLILDVVKDIVSDPRELETIASCAQVHPNEFRKIILGSGEGSKLVLHRWTGQGLHQSDIHSHRWNFCSLVVSGRIMSESFIVEPDVNGDYVQYRYSSPGSSEAYAMNATSTANVFSTGVITFNESEYYVQDYRELHRAGDLAKGSLTIVVQGKAMQETCNVVAPKGARADGIQFIERPSLRQVKSDLAELVDRLIS